ncbi:hypothetical protein [Nocardia sp. BMG51109]|uniref:hypothetical protein n=1 Tax=Nocardia sp. BMG51109 TaxID=1056816 RepID=UPI0004632356|nr:hypothetical protein [Nocardia sp. BMG51109]
MPPLKPERPTGRIDKRQAILNAAFTIFSRDGYYRAGAKRTAHSPGRWWQWMSRSSSTAL